MEWFNSIKTKMALLMLGMVVVSLTLAVLLFISRLSLLQEEAGHTILTAAHHQAQRTLGDMERRLEEVSENIISDENVIASVGLVVNYEDRNDYQPLIFNPAKQQLATLLERYAAGAGIGIAVIYGPQGEPTAFYLPSEAGPVSGYYQYRQGKAELVYTSGEEKTLRPPLHMDAVHEQMSGRLVGKAGLGITGDGTILFDIYQPITDDTFDTGSALRPQLRLGYSIDTGVIEEIAAQAEAGVHLQYGDTVLHAGKAPRVLPEIGKLSVMGDSGGRLAWDEFRAGGMSYMRGAASLPIAGGDYAVISFVQDSQTLSFGIEAIIETVLWLLPGIGILLVIIGQLFARRTIVVPVRRLAEFSSRLGMGKYETIAEIKGAGEFQRLAQAFNSMTSTLKGREEELKASQARFEGIIDNAPAIIYMKDLDGRYVVVNDGFLKLVGKEESEVIGTTDFEHFPEEVASKVRENEQFVIQNRKPLEFEEKTEHRDGEKHTYLSVRFPLLDDRGEVTALCGISTDVTDRKKIERSLTLAHLVIENANEAIVITNLDGDIVQVNDAYERIMGFSRGEVVGRNPRLAKSGRHDQSFYQKMWQELKTSGTWEGEIWDRRKNGEVFPKWLSITTVFDEAGEATHYVAIFSDITSKKQTEEQLEKLAYYDPLTSLPNRMHFHEQLGKAIHFAKRDAGKLALLFLDLDRFKNVNDTLGHNAGDELLVKVGQRLQETVRQSDTVSRLGGDEFTVILGGLESSSTIGILAQKVVDAIARPFGVSGKEVRIGTSIGISVYPDDGADKQQLIKNADLAMYQAKEDGRNTFHFYSDEMQAKLNQRVHLEEAIREAIEREEFVLFYQPKVDIDSGEITGMEALVRWNRPDGSMVSPADFIPVAEETGLIVPMGNWILAEACRQTVEWNRRYDTSLKIAVNLSARQFQDEGLISLIESVSKEEGIPAHSLELEITESMVMGNVNKSITIMEKIKQLGISMAIDDFGTGYSSLNYMKQFPIDTLKVDKSFIQDLQENSDDASIVKAIISMAHSLDLSVVAEGVETAEQLEFLRYHNCETAQGFYLHRPLDADAFERLLSAEHSKVVN